MSDADGSGPANTPRARSHWAWGYEDRLPDAQAREALAQSVGALLGSELRAPQGLPSLDDARLPEPRVSVPGALAGFVVADRKARVEHTYGRGFADLVRGFHGDFSSAPDLVGLARSEDDVRAAMDWCAQERVALVPYGGGTSVVGGVECAREAGAYKGVMALDLRAMDRVLALDEESRAACVEAGATGPVLEAQLGARGYTLRHYPQSFEFSTVGGWIATRAGGHFATMYTHIDERVQAVRMLTARGVYETRRLPGDGAGPAPERLVLGSEGALGVITQAWLRVLPRPRWRASSSARFVEWESAVGATRAIVQAGLFPANCRLLDRDEAMLHGVSDGVSHVLLLGFEGADEDASPLRAALDRARALCSAHGAVEVSEPRVRDEQGGGRDAHAGSWREAFVGAPYLQSALVTLGVVADTFETACTWQAFPALHAAVTRAALDAMGALCGGGRITCRFTHVYPDGPAPYYTFLAPPPKGASLLEAWAQIKRAVSDALLASGGTITHHHAVGRTHRPWYDRQRPEPFALALRAAKRALDPAWVLNPGVLLDEKLDSEV